MEKDKETIAKDKVLEAIRAYFSDTTRSQEETKDGLETFAEEIELLLNALY